MNGENVRTPVVSSKIPKNQYRSEVIDGMALSVINLVADC